MIPFICCLKKDITEIIRKKRLLLFNSLLLLICGFVFITTLTFPNLVSLLAEKAPDIISNGTDIGKIIVKLFPPTLKENIGILASDIGIFFTIAIALICSNIIPSEIKNGKWILVIEAGFDHKILLASKIVSYGMCAAIPTFIMYHLYYLAAGLFLENNYIPTISMINSFVLAFIIFSIASLTISLSVICKNQITAAITIIITVLTAPDILTMFSFGQYLPTHLLTYIYTSSENWREIFMPFCFLMILQIYCYIHADKKVLKLEIAGS